jgi:hypothetical protein
LPKAAGERPAVSPDPAGKWFPIPERYGDPDDSGLELKVKKGSNSFDVSLRD